MDTSLIGYRSRRCVCVHPKTCTDGQQPRVNCCYDCYIPKKIIRILLDLTPYDQVVDIQVNTQPAELGTTGSATCSLLRPCKDCNRLVTFADMDLQTSLCLDCRQPNLPVAVWHSSLFIHIFQNADVGFQATELFCPLPTTLALGYVSRKENQKGQIEGSLKHQRWRLANYYC